MFKLNHVRLSDVDPLCFLANRGIYRLSAYFFFAFKDQYSKHLQSAWLFGETIWL